MRAMVAQIDSKSEVYPGWKMKQVLAHITGWDEAATASIKAFVQGNEDSIVAYRGIDEYNERSVETRQDLNEEQTRKEWEIARIELKVLLESIPPEKFGVEILFPWGQRAPLTNLVNIIIYHERDHVEEIKALTEPSKSPESNTPLSE